MMMFSDVLFPKIRRPYYIFSPGYDHCSSGVRTLHLLCHALNAVGQKAFIYPTDGQGSHPELNAPLITSRIDYMNFYSRSGIEPIVVYPDIIKGNLINARHVVRYLLAPAGAYGGDSTFPESDQIWGALPSIAKKVLRIPVSDPNIFWCNSMFPAPRSGSCFYSHKYDRIHGNPLQDVTKNSIRLEGSLEQVANILRRSEVCYLYELSSVITEAALCGCPVELIKTPYFNTIDPECMMGTVKWHGEEGFIKQVDSYEEEYAEISAKFWQNLYLFVHETQEMAGK